MQPRCRRRVFCWHCISGSAADKGESERRIVVLQIISIVWPTLTIHGPDSNPWMGCRPKSIAVSQILDCCKQLPSVKKCFSNGGIMDKKRCKGYMVVWVSMLFLLKPRWSCWSYMQFISFSTHQPYELPGLPLSASVRLIRKRRRNPCRSFFNPSITQIPGAFRCC